MAKSKVTIFQKLTSSLYDSLNQHYFVNQDMNVKTHKAHTYKAVKTIAEGKLVVEARGDFVYDANHNPAAGTVYTSFKVSLIANGKTKLLYSAQAENGAVSIFDNAAKHIIDKTGDTSGSAGPFALTSYAGNKADTFNGSKKADSFQGYGGADKVFANSGDDSVYGMDGNDIIHGGKGNDRLFGDAGKNKVYGEQGADKLYGGTGKSLLDGGPGNDNIYGGSGGEIIIGGRGNDLLYSSGGADTIRFLKNSKGDHLFDFEAGVDMLEIDHRLYSGTKSVNKILNQFGHADGANYVLDFGNNNVLQIDNATKGEVRDALLII